MSVDSVHVMGLWGQTALCTGKASYQQLGGAELQTTSVSLCYSDNAMRDSEFEEPPESNNAGVNR